MESASHFRGKQSSGESSSSKSSDGISKSKGKDKSSRISNLTRYLFTKADKKSKEEKALEEGPRISKRRSLSLGHYLYVAKLDEEYYPEMDGTSQNTQSNNDSAEEYQHLQEQYTALERDFQGLQRDKDTLEGEKQRLKALTNALERENQHLRDLNKAQQEKIQRLHDLNKAQERENQHLH